MFYFAFWLHFHGPAIKCFIVKTQECTVFVIKANLVITFVVVIFNITCTKCQTNARSFGFGTNLRKCLFAISPVEFMRATIGGMADRGWGRIVNIGTVAAKHPTEVRLLSGAPRAALVNYTAAVARKVARQGVIINNLLPGMYHTATIHDR